MKKALKAVTSYLQCIRAGDIHVHYTSTRNIQMYIASESNLSNLTDEEHSYLFQLLNQSELTHILFDKSQEYTIKNNFNY